MMDHLLQLDFLIMATYLQEQLKILSLDMLISKFTTSSAGLVGIVMVCL